MKPTNDVGILKTWGEKIPTETVNGLSLKDAKAKVEVWNQLANKLKANSGDFQLF